MGKSLTILVLTAAGLGLAQPAQATITQWNGSGSNDQVNLSALGGNLATVNSGTTTTSSNGVGVTITDAASPMQLRIQGTSWFGNFGSGEYVLYNQNLGTITFSFASPVSAAGAQIQGTTYGDYTARITTNDGTFFDLMGVSSDLAHDTNPFLGVISNSANITSVTFSLTAPNPSFAISNLFMIDAPGVPEPATWSMMLLGFGALGLSLRRRRRLGAKPVTA